MAENNEFATETEYPYERIVSAVLSGKEPSEEDKKTISEDELKLLKEEIQEAQRLGLVVEVAF